MTNTIEQKAQELANSVMAQVQEEREKLAKRMLELGYTDESHIILDNMLEVIEDIRVPYKCWAEMKPKFTRGANDGTI